MLVSRHNLSTPALSNSELLEPLAKFSITTGLIGGVAVVQRYGGHRSIGDEAFKSW